MSNREILVSETIDKSLPVVIVDFDYFNLVDVDDINWALSIVNNLKSAKNIYATSKDNNPIKEVASFKKLSDWSKDKGDLFLKDLSEEFPDGTAVQLCGVYRELCIVEVANLIKRSNLNIEPIIVNNDKYSISAIYSVQEGDTLENRLAECNCSAKYI